MIRDLTFLFTDIEGSTQMWEQFPNEMYVLLEMHDEILRDEIHRHGGDVFRTVGDAFYATFDSPDAAIRASISIQHILGSQSWKPLTGMPVRIGIHSGKADTRDNDYFGPELNRVHRVLSAGHGGQILVTEQAKELLHGCSTIELQDLGQHRLRDLSIELHIFQVLHSDLPSKFPRLRTVDPISSNLPVQLTSFVGRLREVAQIQHLLSSTRILTLVGTGGCGKTRLAIQVGATLLEQFQFVWFTSLAGSTQGTVESEILFAVGETGREGRALEKIANRIGDSNTLLILDNCEQVIDKVAETVSRLVSVCPGLVILSTSRESLTVAGEATYHVPAMSVGSAESESTILFFHRAAAVNPTWFATPDEVAAICNRLDGLPLAIELAASRAKYYSAEDIAAGLDDRFSLLRSRSRSAELRHQTLYGCIEWSYKLLEEPLQSAFLCLSSLTESFNLAAASAVCGMPKDALAEVLITLCEQSLLQKTPASERFRMLQSIAEFGRQKLIEFELMDAVQTRLAEYFAGHSKNLAAHIYVNQIEAIDLMEADRQNFGTAILNASPEVAAEIVLNLRQLWEYRRYAEHGLELIAHVLSCVPESSNWIAHLQQLGGELYMRFGNFEEAHRRIEAAKSAFSKSGNELGIAACYHTLGNIDYATSQFEAAAQNYCHAIALREANADQQGIADSRHNYAVVLSEMGMHDQAHQMFAECIALANALGDDILLGMALNNLGSNCAEAGDFVGGCSAYEKSLLQADRTKDELSRATVLNNLGTMRRKLGNTQEALRLFDEAISLAEHLKELNVVNSACTNAAWSCSVLGRWTDAHQYLIRAFEIDPEGVDSRNACYVLEASAMLADYAKEWEVAGEALAASSRLRSTIQHPVKERDREEIERLEKHVSAHTQTNLELLPDIPVIMRKQREWHSRHLSRLLNSKDSS